MKLFNSLIITALFAFVCIQHTSAQELNSKDVILKAMKDELARNVNQLRVEKLAEPFFINYSIRSGKTFEVKAKHGSIIGSNEFPLRTWNTRVMVGSYQFNDENFFDISSFYSNYSTPDYTSIPIENDYEAIRRTFWLSTDKVFKSAAEKYERKKATMKQQSISKEIANLPDYTSAEPIKSYNYLDPINIDKVKWENTAKEISALFKNQPEIFESEVRIYFYLVNDYLVNSEGTEIVKPLTLASIQINAYSQADDGEELVDHVLEYALLPDDLPSKSDVIKKTENMIDRLKKLRGSPTFDVSYTGPVLFENEAAAELFAQRFFRDRNGLLATRKPFAGDPNSINYVNNQYGESLEGKLDRRIISKEITIKAVPTTEEFAKTKLIGFNEIDAEGIKPKEEINLVENGILKTLLSNRTPTSAVSQSNGHLRSKIGYQSGGSLGASVINVSATNGLTDDELKKELIQAAKDEGLEYGIIVRKIKSIVTGNMPGIDRVMMSYGNQQKKNLEELIYVYKIYVKDGSEELIRSVEIDDPSISSLRHILGVSKRQFVYNNLMPVCNENSPYSIDGVPTSFITPNAVLLEELEVRKEKRNYTPKPPVVESPLLSTK
jgi:hypothetical protein